MIFCYFTQRVGLTEVWWR